MQSGKDLNPYHCLRSEKSYISNFTNIIKISPYGRNDSVILDIYARQSITLQFIIISLCGIVC